VWKEGTISGCCEERNDSGFRRAMSKVSCRSQYSVRIFHPVRLVHLQLLGTSSLYLLLLTPTCRNDPAIFNTYMRLPITHCVQDGIIRDAQSPSFGASRYRWLMLKSSTNLCIRSPCGQQLSSLLTEHNSITAKMTR
jgi:hypothetical protein